MGYKKQLGQKKLERNNLAQGIMNLDFGSGDHMGSLKVRRDLVMYGLGIAEGVNNLA